MKNFKEALKYILAFLLGAVFTAIVVVVLMPSMMIQEYQVLTGVDETVEKLTKSIQENGWSVSGIQNMNEAMKKNGVDFPYKVRLVKLCKAQYASEVLRDSPFVSCLMPCTISVYQKSDGKTYISKMNTGLMGKLFGGTIRQVMGEKVSQDEEKILSVILKDRKL